MGIPTTKLRMSMMTFIFLEYVTNMTVTKLKVKLNMHNTATGLEPTEDVLQGIRWADRFAFSFH